MFDPNQGGPPGATSIPLPGQLQFFGSAQHDKGRAISGAVNVGNRAPHIMAVGVTPQAGAEFKNAAIKARQTARVSTFSR